jgi:hypothetical protein
MLFSAAICVQILELISEKKGADHEAFQNIRADLEKLRATSDRSSKQVPPSPVGVTRAPPPPPGPGPDAKRPRLS